MTDFLRACARDSSVIYPVYNFLCYLCAKTSNQKIMKHNFLIAAFSVALLSTGCSDEDQSISIDIGPEVIPAEGGKAVLTFTPPMAWSACISDAESEDGTTWLTIDPVSGDASYSTITATALPNENENERTALVTISSGSRQASVRITQSGRSGDISDEPVPVPETAVKQVTISDPGNGYEDNFAFRYDNEGRVIEISGQSYSSSEHTSYRYIYNIHYEEGKVRIAGDDGISMEATLDEEGRISDVLYSETDGYTTKHSRISLTYDSDGYLAQDTETSDSYSDYTTSYTWTDGNIVSVIHEYYDSEYRYSSYPNTGNIDLNWLLTAGYGSSLAPLGMLNLIGNRCENYVNPDYWNMDYEVPDMMLMVSEDDLDKPVTKEGFYYRNGEKEIQYVFGGPENCLSSIHVETPVERVHYTKTGTITYWNPEAYEIREDGKKYFYDLTIDWEEEKETWTEIERTDITEVTIEY